MRQLVSAVGQSRLNILAAIERVKPNKLILFMDEKIVPLTKQQILISTGIPDLDVQFFKLTDVNNIEKMNSEINEYSTGMKFSAESYVLTSAGTNALAMKLILLNNNFIKVSIYSEDNLNSVINGIHEAHEFDEESVKSIHSLIIEDKTIFTPELEIELNNDEEFSSNSKSISWNADVVFEKDHFQVIYELQDETENNALNMGLLKHKAIGQSMALSGHFGKKLFQTIVLDKNNHLHKSESKYIQIRS